jgi:hypothetical protein
VQRSPLPIGALRAPRSADEIEQQLDTNQDQSGAWVPQVKSGSEQRTDRAGPKSAWEVRSTDIPSVGRQKDSSDCFKLLADGVPQPCSN